MQQRMKMKYITYKTFTAIAVLLMYRFSLSHQICISSDTTTVVCDNNVPIILPSNVTVVYIRSSIDLHFHYISFSHKSWQAVTILQAKYKHEIGDIDVSFGSMCFSSLHALKVLRIQGDEINSFHPDSFNKLVHLKELRFFDCNYMDINSVMTALSNSNITVETLVLEDVCGANVDRIAFNEFTYTVLRQMKVTSLSLRKTVFKITFFQNQQIKPISLTALDISQTTMLIPNQVNIQLLQFIHASVIQDLKTLNISSIPVQFFLPDNNFLNNRIIRRCDELPKGFLQFFVFSVENLYSNALFRTPVIMNNSMLNISDCQFNLKVWHFKENSVQYLNISFCLPLTNSLTEVDVSNNEIKYMSPSAVQNAFALEILKLGSNELFQMESLSDFNDLLLSYTALKYVCLADNKLSYLPRDMFRNNAVLETIDLADNNLKSISFTLTHLDRLKSLTIARNHIQFLEDNALRNIQLVLKTHASAGSNQTTAAIEMTGNPFQCSCESVRFMEWVISLEQNNKRKYYCSMEGEEMEINKQSLFRSKYWLCYRTVIIAGVSTGGFILFLGTILLLICIRGRKRKQEKQYKRKRFLKDFQKGILKETYLCQISYSSDDEACFLNIIYPSLKTALENILNCKREVICTGDSNFCPGRSIVDEISRCMSMCCVNIFVISKSFCASRWCEMELKEAFEMGKPMILIYKEDVKSDLMSKLLFKLFNKLTRPKLVENDGGYELNIGWKTLGESIIELATENQREYQPD